MTDVWFWALRMSKTWFNGQPMRGARNEVQVTIQSDASDVGWGAHSEDGPEGGWQSERRAAPRHAGGELDGAGDHGTDAGGGRRRRRSCAERTCDIRMDSYPAIRNLVNGGGPVEVLNDLVREWWHLVRTNTPSSPATSGCRARRTRGGRAVQNGGAQLRAAAARRDRNPRVAGDAGRAGHAPAAVAAHHASACRCSTRCASDWRKWCERADRHASWCRHGTASSGATHCDDIPPRACASARHDTCCRTSQARTTRAWRRTLLSRACAPRRKLRQIEER